MATVYFIVSILVVIASALGLQTGFLSPDLIEVMLLVAGVLGLVRDWLKKKLPASAAFLLK